MTAVDPSGSMDGPSLPRQRIALRLAYEGTRYCGWQAQPGRMTVQGTLADAIHVIDSAAGEPRGASRTDAGVHALGQVAAFTTGRGLSPDAWVRAINANLPADVAVLEAWQVPPHFDPVRSAIRKRYLYRLHDDPVRSVFARHLVWRQPARLNLDAMREAAAILVGEHDFTSFETTPSQRISKIRTIHSLRLERNDGQGQADSEVHVDVVGNGFLYNMVRIIVGSLVMVGSGRRPPCWMRDVLEARTRASAGPTAPPDGLVLVSIELDAATAA